MSVSAADRESTEIEEQLVAFYLGSEIYAIEINSISEIIRAQAVTQVPRTRDDIEGIINLRGKIVPVLDLCKRLALSESQSSSKSRIIVVNAADFLVGLIVDSVVGVVRLPDSAIERKVVTSGSLDSDYILGVGKYQDSLVILLNLNELLQPEHDAAIAA